MFLLWILDNYQCIKDGFWAAGLLPAFGIAQLVRCDAACVNPIEPVLADGSSTIRPRSYPRQEHICQCVGRQRACVAAVLCLIFSLFTDLEHFKYVHWEDAGIRAKFL